MDSKKGSNKKAEAQDQSKKPAAQPVSAPAAPAAASTTPAAAATAAPAAAPRKSHAGRVLLIIVIILVILGIGGYVVTKYVLPRIFKTAVEKTVESATGGKVQVSDNGKGVTVQDKTGNNSFSTSGSLPSGFPSDVPIYPGASIVSSGKANGTDYDVVLKTNDTSSKATSYYQSAMPQNGWTADSSNSTDASGASSLVFNKDTRSVTLIIASQNNQTVINITVATQSQ